MPDITACAAKCTACWAEPHWRSTVVPGTCSGSPATSQHVRAMSPACGPMLSTLPKIDVVDRAGVDPGALDQRRDRVTTQVGGVHLRQAAAAPPDGRAHRIDDVRLGHGVAPASSVVRLLTITDDP